MSTLRVSAVNNAAASVGGLAIDSSGNVTGALPAPNRNLLYNGAMQLSQRGTSTTGITSSGYYTADRWQTVGPTTAGTWTQDIQTDAPTGSGFRRSLRMLCTTANNSLSAGSFLFIGQTLEGQDLQRIRKGTSSAQRLTLSFWVKSNVTGTYAIELTDADNTRICCATYTVSASATWERKTITFPADTTGAFDNDNAASLQLCFWLVAGSTFTSGTLQTTWAANNNANRAVGQTNLASATNNYWQVTGFQLEVGDVATDFEFKSYGQELRECQRYYYRATAGDNDPFGSAMCYSTTGIYAYVPFQVRMRVAPTAVEVTSTAADYEVTLNSTANQACTSVPTYGQAGEFGAAVAAVSSTGNLVQGQASFLMGGVSNNGYLGFSAEL